MRTVSLHDLTSLDKHSIHVLVRTADPTILLVNLFLQRRSKSEEIRMPQAIRRSDPGSSSE